MVKDYHPTPDIREFDASRTLTFGNRETVLQFSGIDYGTHTGAVFRAIEAGSGAEIASLPFEAHWHKRGRYLIQVGPARSGAQTDLSDRLAEIAGLHASQALMAAMARARVRTDLFDNLKAAAADVVGQIAQEAADGGV